MKKYLFGVVCVLVISWLVADLRYSMNPPKIGTLNLLCLIELEKSQQIRSGYLPPPPEPLIVRVRAWPLNEFRHYSGYCGHPETLKKRGVGPISPP